LDREVNLAATQSEHERQRQRPPIGTLSRIPIEGHASFYVCSDARLGFKEGLPVIMCIGHAFQQPETLLQFVGKFSEPVLLIWSDVLSDLSAGTPVDDEAVWRTKRLEFAKQFSRYREILRFDERRVYLTGFSFAGVYAWMLAYDSPDLYAGVVAMSAVSYPQPIQQRLQAGQVVVTLVVRGEMDTMYPKHLLQEKRTAQAIESFNSHSRFLIKRGETHREVAKYWTESLACILQFRKDANRNPNSPRVPPHVP
jgi:pimeloyl-ACP methyl ester carboxylesterase